MGGDGNIHFSIFFNSLPIVIYVILVYVSVRNLCMVSENVVSISAILLPTFTL